MRHPKARELGQARVALMGGIQCPLCLKFFFSLGCHVSLSHGLSPRDFRKKMGYRHDRSLVVDFKREEYRRKGIELAKNQPKWHMERMRQANTHPRYVLSVDGKIDKLKYKNPKYADKTCLQCGNTFKAKFCEKDVRKYCSTICSNHDYSRHKRKI